MDDQLIYKPWYLVELLIQTPGDDRKVLETRIGPVAHKHAKEISQDGGVAFLSVEDGPGNYILAALYYSGREYRAVDDSG